MLIELAERGVVPDAMLRTGVKLLAGVRLLEERERNAEKLRTKKERFVQRLRAAPIAVEQQAANDQHYELPASFFQLALGPHRKYSCCYWLEGVESLAAAEAASLAQVCQRAEIQDGMSILELGCGWGSLTLWMAERFPHASITAVSNSGSQREYIESEAGKRGLKNITVLTTDVLELQLEEQFDRVVSIEMFEHMRNYEALLQKIALWLKEDGKLFVHVFCHRELAYAFETEGPTNWLGRYFFTGGLMPSHDLFLFFQKHLLVETTWSLSGTHYQKTANAWVANMDHNREHILEIFRETYGDEADRWFHRWRLFFIACAELFGYKQGNEWGVVHYLFRKRS